MSTVIGPNEWASVTALFYSFSTYAEANNEPVGSSKRFSQRLDGLHFERRTQNNKRGFLGIGLKPEPGPRAYGEAEEPEPKVPPF